MVGLFFFVAKAIICLSVSFLSCMTNGMVNRQPFFHSEQPQADLPFSSFPLPQAGQGISSLVLGVVFFFCFCACSFFVCAGCVSFSTSSRITSYNVCYTKLLRRAIRRGITKAGPPCRAGPVPAGHHAEQELENLVP